MPVVVNKDLCLGCGACVSVCPVEALSLDADGHAESNKDVCIDCGNEVKIKLKDTKTCRCEDCQENFRRKYRAEKQRIYRNKDDVLTDQPQKFDPS